ncbi:MAG: DUF3332 family protein [Planctomycetes bacterium]|nr:DUF3332 family protein [Planctomycetota bacterium]
MHVVPVYPLALLGDSVIFNTIDYWNGKPTRNDSGASSSCPFPRALRRRRGRSLACRGLDPRSKRLRLPPRAARAVPCAPACARRAAARARAAPGPRRRRRRRPPGSSPPGAPHRFRAGEDRARGRPSARP